MLKRFEVQNFRNFKDNFVFDLSETGQYEFNEDCVKNGIVRSAIIYGKNGSGKSNLGLAIFELIRQITDHQAKEDYYDKAYLNADSDLPFATFKYIFQFDTECVEYSYGKFNHKTITYEELKINGFTVVSYIKGRDLETTLKGTETLNKDLSSNPNISAIKYIRSNAVLDSGDKQNIVFNQFTTFIDKMLNVISVKNYTYIGNQTGSRNLQDEIITKDKIKDYENFLNLAGVDCKLAVYEENGEKKIGFEFKNSIQPWSIASTGTKDLTLFYFWYLTILENKCSLLLIDEFDAHYHFEASRMVFDKLKESGVQFLLTTHNTALLNNELIRPDCCFIIDKNKIANFRQATEKELRQSHNIEKMYRARAFQIA